QKLVAELQLPDGLAKLVAPSGKFNPVTQQMDVSGPITFAGPNNYTLQTNGAIVDLKTKTMEGAGGVWGTVPQGSFTADRMSADLDARVVRLDGRARLRIAPRRAR
ncbi:MAG: LPS export ABC transporter periplasmic protein LptC, partial [Proteobacteria bacterium]|nr:LPS export ABC transporter periplasmic protein LptC [Pseudomonadota bacterium]